MAGVVVRDMSCYCLGRLNSNCFWERARLRLMMLICFMRGLFVVEARGEWCVRVLVVVFVGALAVGIGVVQVARADCVNAALRGRGVVGSELPDCRAFEQVSPVDKNLTDVLGFPGAVEASPRGDRVSFFSLSPLPGGAGAPNLEPVYMGVFAGGGWLTEGLLARAEPGAEGQAVLGWGRDLSRSVVAAEEPLLTSEPVLIVGVGDVSAVPGQTNFYVRVGTSGPALYRLLAPGPGDVHFVGATVDGSRILFEDDAQLTPSAAESVSNLYEWDEGRVSLVGVLPDGLAPVKGTVAGPGGPLIEAERGVGKTGGAADSFYTQDTITDGGVRVFFSDAGTGLVYMREPGAERTVQVSAGEAYWRDAAPDGGYVFYTEGEELYRFNVDRFESSGKPEPEALAEAREQLTAGAEGVPGVTGISEDGAYVYFVALGKLASNKNSNGREAVKGAVNLYEWHEGVTTYAANLNGEDYTDWRGFGFLGSGAEASTADHGEKSSRVTPSGASVLFSSRELTSYAKWSDGAVSV